MSERPFMGLMMKREKLFGDGRTVPMDRNLKSRVMVLARALSRRTAPGRAYGVLTAKALAVLYALLWSRHNARTGLCTPSYDTIADDAGCARSTVNQALKALERAGILTWCHRLVRVRDAGQVRVLRTSNGYRFKDPAGVSIPISSKSDFQSGTGIKKQNTLRERTATALRAASEGAFGEVGRAIDIPPDATPAEARRLLGLAW